jgi:hypothetical protein
METQQAPIVFIPHKQDSFLRKRHTTTIAFAVGILLFLLPFAQLKCGGMTLAENSGIGIALGTEWNIAMVGSSSDLLKDKSKTGKNDKDNPLKGGDPNIFAIVALVTAAIGLAFGLSNQKYRAMMGLCTGILAAIMLVAVMVQFKMAMSSAISNDKSETLKDVNMGAVLKLQFTIWYFLSLASFAAAAFFSYKHHQQELEEAIGKVVDFEFQERRQP